MKSSVLTLVMAVNFFSLNAGASTLECFYNTRPDQKVTFEAPNGFDFDNVAVNEVEIKINGSQEITRFGVSIAHTKKGAIAYYSHRNPFFVNDIVITYDHSDFTSEPKITATWTTDYPPVHQFTCDFI